MKNVIDKSITKPRFTQLLTAYGADPARWPDAERAAARAFLQDNAEARVLLNEAVLLDQWLQSSAVHRPAFSGLEARLLQRVLPARESGLMDRLLTWLLPSSDLPLRQLWRPVAVACLPLAIGLLVGFQVELVPEAYATTVEEELYLISLSDYAEVL